MTDKFERVDHTEADRIAVLESRAADLERRLLAATQANVLAGWVSAAAPGEHAVPGVAAHTGGTGAFPDYTPPGADESGAESADDDSGGGTAGTGRPGRTEELLSHGRRGGGRSPGQGILGRGLLRHWRVAAIVVVAVVAGVAAVLVTAGGGPTPSWPASVAVMQGEITQACGNPDTAAEPSGLDFACAKDSQQVLWVFALLTSGGNPGYVDTSTGRRGLEPITTAQGGEVFWSLNAHHPYNPMSPTDSLTVAARAIDNIVAGATVTSASGAQQVEPGLESTAANCQRYTGSPSLVSRAGYPARCAAPLTDSGTAALVSDVFAQWTGGTPSRLAAEAGTLYANADNPGNPQVQAILATLPASGG